MSESLRDLRIFIAVYEERSFTAAATREHATQSGVSQHIRSLEVQLGIKLFWRGVGLAVQPTPAADVYYRACVDVLRAHEHARMAVKPFGAGVDGQITVGLVPTITRSSLVPALTRFISEHPNVGVRIFEGFSDALTERVRAGELDFAIVIEATGSLGLKSSRIARTPEVLVSGTQYGLRHLEPLRIADLGPLKMVVTIRSKARRHRIEAYVSTHGAVIERRLELDTAFGMLDFIAKTDWVTILPSIMMVANIDKSALTINPLVDPPLWLDLVLIEPSLRPLSPAAIAFFEILSSETRLMADHVARLVSL